MRFNYFFKIGFVGKKIVLKLYVNSKNCLRYCTKILDNYFTNLLSQSADR